MTMIERYNAARDAEREAFERSPEGARAREAANAALSRTPCERETRPFYAYAWPVDMGA